MTTKPSFTLRRVGGRTEEVQFTPLMVIAGSTTHKLALHKDNLGHWVVSDPKSGACVVRHVQGQYKGLPVSSRGFSLRDIRQLALADVELVIQRVGADKFNAVLAAGLKG